MTKFCFTVNINLYCSYFRMLYNKVRRLHASVEEITNEINDWKRNIEQLNSKYSVTFICISKINPSSLNIY